MSKCLFLVASQALPSAQNRVDQLSSSGKSWLLGFLCLCGLLGPYDCLEFLEGGHGYHGSKYRYNEDSGFLYRRLSIWLGPSTHDLSTWTLLGTVP